MIKILRCLKAHGVLSMAVLLFSYDAMAWDACRAIFTSTFPESQTEDLGSCQTCHTGAGGGAFNRYGQDLRANGASGAGFNCDQVDFAQALLNVNNLDSDEKGGSNAVEITASTQPGWCDIGLNPGCTNPGGTPPDVPLDPVPVNNVPIADVGGPYFGEAGTAPVQFDGSRSSDMDNDPLTYAWEFGDGSGGTGVNPTHTYGASGSFEVRLVVRDGKDNSAPSITTAEITAPPTNLAPVADPGGPYVGQPGIAVAFDGSASSDPNGDTITGYFWEFGDGASGDGVGPSHAYAAEGVYTVSLTVNDGALDSPIVTTTAEIAAPLANRAPVADAGGPYSAETGTPIVFDGTASSDPDDDALTFAWTFGDGGTGSAATPTHTYTAAGRYEIILIVSDGAFQSDAASTVEVHDPAEQSDGQVLYGSQCLGCHGDPWGGAAVDDSLPGLRRVAGSRSCNINGSIFGTSVFPNGVPEMQHLQGLTESEIAAVADYLNSVDTSGERRYVATCAGCHGNDGSGGRVGEDVHGASAGETWEAIEEESEMRYLACMPRDDIDLISDYLRGLDDDNDDDGVDDDADNDDDNDGIHDDDDDDDDNDGMSDEDERENGTDPRDRDSDDDGLDDGEEHEYGTDPLDSDSDDDGNSDGREVKELHTNPLVADAATRAPVSNGGGAPGPLWLVLLALCACWQIRYRAATR